MNAELIRLLEKRFRRRPRIDGRSAAEVSSFCVYGWPGLGAAGGSPFVRDEFDDGSGGGVFRRVPSHIRAPDRFPEVYLYLAGAGDYELELRCVPAECRARVNEFVVASGGTVERETGWPVAWVRVRPHEWQSLVELARVFDRDVERRIASNRDRQRIAGAVVTLAMTFRDMSAWGASAGLDARE